MLIIRSHIVRAFCVLALFGAGGSLRAQSLELYERILLPVSTYKAPGAYGTLWSTELWFRNNSGRYVDIYPTMVPHWRAAVGRTNTIPVAKRPLDRPGQFLFVTRAYAAEVQFDLRLYNEAARHDNWGTKLPVVRESEYARTVNLINVPTDPAYRSALRIYGLPDHAPSQETVVVRIYSTVLSEPLLATAELPFDAAIIQLPQYAGIGSLTDAFPTIRNAQQVRVEVTSRSGTAKLWAFVSVVANSTQEVSLVTPD